MNINDLETANLFIGTHLVFGAKYDHACASCYEKFDVDNLPGNKNTF
jgi:hypothetical protein